MRKCILAVLLAAACSTFAAAQMPQNIFEVPKSEIYGGYAWQHAELTSPLSGAGNPITQKTASLRGFAVGYAHYLFKNLGFALEVSRVSNGALDVTGIGYTRTSYVGGPTIRLHRYGFFSPAIHVMAGIDHASLKIPSNGTVSPYTDTDVAVLAGGVLDGNLSRHPSGRLVQADYLSPRH